MATPGPTRDQYRPRPYQRDDRDQVLELIDADRLPGQPPARARDLIEALAGRSTVDAGWWTELSDLRTDVVTDPAGLVVGVVSFARRARDQAGLLLWLHAREQEAVVSALIHHVLTQLGDCATIHAFDFATALSRGLEALPARHRATTARTLRAAGFTGTDLWRYMRRELPAEEPMPPAGAPGLTITATACADPEGWTLTASRGEAAIGSTTVGAPEAGIGVLWWIGVDAGHRGSGVGRSLLNSALTQLRDAGAREVILYVDDDDPPGGERDRTAANHLYDRMGFVEVDRLIAFKWADVVTNPQLVRRRGQA
jgi:ribosomal protein S18 acetylase RimI-like enzyme